jgi:septum site-determining protein MinD
MTRVISIASSKGGVGKTVTVTNLGVALASKFNKNVVVIDCNLTNPHLGLHMGMFSFWPITLNNVLRNEAELKHAIHTHSSGLKIIPASFDLRDLEAVDMKRLRSRIRRTFENFDADIVLLDSSPGLLKEALLTLRCSEEVLFVATPHLPAIVDITKCCNLLKETDAKPIGIILNRVKDKLYELKEDEITKFTNLPVISKIPEDENILRSTNFKVPLVSSDPNSRASRAFIKLAADIIGEDYKPEIGFFRRFFASFRKN